MTQKDLSCVEPAKGPILPETAQPEARTAPSTKERPMVLARVGREAPDFEASAYYEGGFTNIRLSDFRGQWVVLCFYPGDFTFV